MFHQSNLGSFDTHVAQFADLNGYVPQAADDHADMVWDAATEWTPAKWRAHIEEAYAATDEAEKAIAEWREND